MGTTTARAANPTRRDVLKAGGVGLLTFCVAGCDFELTPREAREAGADLGVLTPHERTLLESLGDVLLPGCREEGFANYIDQQLGAGIADTMLMIKYLGVNPPFAPFYKEGLAALDELATARHRQGFAALSPDRATALVADLAAEKLENWRGPPAGLFYFVLRNDACDVLYGTRKGFAALGVPYSAHIAPPSPWGSRA